MKSDCFKRAVGLSSTPALHPWKVFKCSSGPCSWV